MRYLTFVEEIQNTYKYVFLAPQLRKREILEEYIIPFGISQKESIALNLHISQIKKKTPVQEIKEYIQEELVPVFTQAKTKYIIVGDGDYFKVLTKVQKVEAYLGYVMDCVYGPWKVVYVPYYKRIQYNPEVIRKQIHQSMNALIEHTLGLYNEPGYSIIGKDCKILPDNMVAAELHKIHKYTALTCDIETYSLKHYDAGIGTIAFCWSKHNGIVFSCDKSQTDKNDYIRALLKKFFMTYQGNLKFHNISFDVTVLIYQLFMKDILDTGGMYEGMKYLLRDWDCTKIISWLATNSCSRIGVDLKSQAQEFAGNYAVEEIKDITKIPINKLLQYNLVDGLSTWFVYEKNYPIMVNDKQLSVYENIFKPATKDIIQMQLTGLPIDMEKTRKVAKELKDKENLIMERIMQDSIIKDYTYILRDKIAEAKNKKWKVKRITGAELSDMFNPNSSNQVQGLLYKFLKLPILKLTDSNQPSTDMDTLTALQNYTENQNIKDLLQSFIDYSTINKINTSFIPAMLKAKKGPDGWHYLFGSFNLGGTVSGRLSSSNPNLQNLPATGTKYAKIIKSCFAAPPGWIFCGLDFDSLEDRISALTTKDSNKLKVYTDGYDGHCLRAYAYFKDRMPDIVMTVESINSIILLYPKLRQRSKTPTFALTYQGTYKTLMNAGFSEEEARSIETNYHILYAESDAWIQDKLTKAMSDGYVTVAFGLRVRTPLLKQVLPGSKRIPYEAQSEGRTAGNALGQSWGLLNNRACSEFMSKVRTSKYKHTIKPSCHIHDSQYYLIKDDIYTLLFLNKHLVEAVKWQNHPDIYHDEVKLGGSLEIYYPDWSNKLSIPNYATEPEIRELVQEYIKTL